MTPVASHQGGQKSARSARTQDDSAVRLNAVLEASEAVGSDADLSVTLHMIAQATLDVVQGTQAVSISLRDGRTRGELYLAAAIGLSREYIDVLNRTRRGQIGRGISGLAMKTRAPVVVTDVAHDPRCKEWRTAMLAEGFGSLLSMPLAVDDTVVGVLNIYRTTAAHPTKTQLRVLSAVARQAALAVRQAQFAHASAVHIAVVESTLASLRAQAHEFSNRLHAISGLLSIGEYDQAQAFIGSLAESGGMPGNDLTDRIGDITLAAYLISATRQAASRGVELRIDPCSSLERLPPNSDILTFIVLVGNLIDNAVDAVAELSESRRRVVVRITQNSELTALAVSDHGEGLPVAETDEIFRPGFSTKPTGKGIGLALVFDEIHRLGGTLTVTRDSGNWTTFSAEIPHRADD